MENKQLNKEAIYLINQLRVITFNPGILRLNSITGNINQANKQLKVRLMNNFIKENELKIEDYSIKKFNFKLTSSGLSKLNTKENKELEFSDNLKLFAELLIDSYFNLIEKRVKSPVRTWNIKLYCLENEFYSYAKNLSNPLFLLKKIFLIQAEEKRNVSWLMEAVTAYAKKEMVRPTSEYHGKTLFASKKMNIVVSLSNLNISLINHIDKIHFTRSFELKELPIFKNILGQFDK